jgi:phage baseplate assembly protein W
VTTRQLIRERITQAIGRWEPRVAVQDVLVEPVADEPREVAITILFRLVVTGATGRLGLTLQLEG